MLTKSFDIPQNIMDLEGNEFFDFIKQYSGEKVAILLEFQDISNVNCLLACHDPLEILSFDSNDLLDLKKTTCVKLNNNSFTVLPGIKTKMNLLKSTLMKKYNALKKDVSKISSNIFLTNNLSVNTLVNNNINTSTDSFVNTSLNSSSSGIIDLKAEDQIKQYLIEALNDWCKKMNQNNINNNKILKLQENIDYEIIVDINGKKVLIRCQCGATSTLGRKENTYIKTLIMSDTPLTIDLKEQVLSFRSDSFYDLVKQQCGTIAFEIMQV
ncbi:unnamed protein product [Rotaria sp. Silwood2]|nr:unnamed protein product [Rotaria sp. Silwood2]